MPKTPETNLRESFPKLAYLENDDLSESHIAALFTFYPEARIQTPVPSLLSLWSWFNKHLQLCSGSHVCVLYRGHVMSSDLGDRKRTRVDTQSRANATDWLSIKIICQWKIIQYNCTWQSYAQFLINTHTRFFVEQSHYGEGSTMGWQGFYRNDSGHSKSGHQSFASWVLA